MQICCTVWFERRGKAIYNELQNNQKGKFYKSQYILLVGANENYRFLFFCGSEWIGSATFAPHS